MIVSARGPRRNRVWVEVRARLGRDVGASGARHVRTRGRVRQGSVGHGFVDKPTIHVLHGGAECGVGLRFQNMGGCAA